MKKFLLFVLFFNISYTLTSLHATEEKKKTVSIHVGMVTILNYDNKFLEKKYPDIYKYSEQYRKNNEYGLKSPRISTEECKALKENIFKALSSEGISFDLQKSTLNNEQSSDELKGYTY